MKEGFVGTDIFGGREVAFTREELEEALLHYGIPGMRWGYRKDSAAITLTRKKRLKEASKEEKFLKKVGKKPSDVAKSLTDEELSNRVKRLQMEKLYVDLINQSNDKNRTTFNRGVGAVNKVLADSGKEVLKQVITKNTVKELEKRKIIPKTKKK